MEPFRQIIDYTVLINRNTTFFSTEIREMLVKSLNIKVKINGKMHFLNNAIDMYVDEFVKGKEPL
jgi:hypothetical protein